MDQVKQNAEWHFMRGLTRNGPACKSSQDDRTRIVEAPGLGERTDMILKLLSSLERGSPIVVIVLDRDSGPNRLG